MPYLRDIFKLRNPFFRIAAVTLHEGENRVKLFARVERVELLQLPVHCPPRLILVLAVRDTRYLIALKYSI